MIIEIKKLTFNTIIGVLDFERLTPQRVVIDIQIEYSYKQSRYINYALIVEDIEDYMQKEKFELLEDALLGLKELLFKKYSLIEKLFIKIAKPDILDNAIVSLADSWEREA